MRRIVPSVVAAVCGLGAAVGVTLAATEITDQEIGLGSEPLTAGRELAPPKRPASRARTVTAKTSTTRTTPPRRTTPTVPDDAPTVSTPPPTVENDDDGGSGQGRGQGRGRGRGGEDDD